MQPPNLEALTWYLHLQAHLENMNDSITQWLSSTSQLSHPIYQQHILLLLVLPLLYFMLRPLSPCQDLYFMVIPMFSLCDDLSDHIACNLNVLEHVEEYFRMNFQATRRTASNVPNRLPPGYWHIIPILVSGTILCLGTLVELIISMSCTIAMIAVTIATTMLALDWRLQTVDWLDEGILQTYRDVEESVERTFLDSAFWAGLMAGDVVIHAVNGRKGKLEAKRDEVEEMEQAAGLRIME